MPKKISGGGVAVAQPPINNAQNSQRIKYPDCGCEVVGVSPLPADCPTHGVPGKTKIATAVDDVPDTLIAVLLDESGSMSTNKAETISAYNAYLAGVAKDGKGKRLVTLTKFDASPPDPTCRIVYKNEPVDSAPLLTNATYDPRGYTPLYDAIGNTVKALEPEASGRSVLVVVVTDGQENASIEYTAEKIKPLIAEKEKVGWVFVYLGAHADAWTEGAKAGFAKGNTYSYTAANVGNVMTNVARGAATYTAMSMSARNMMPNDDFLRSMNVNDIEAPMATITTNVPLTTGTTGSIISTISASDLGKLGGAARAKGMTPEQASAHGRNAANARWAKQKRPKTQG